MSYLTYNGITLVPTRTIEIEERPEFSDDGLTYLWMYVRITVEALYNPRQTAYVLNGGVPTATPGTMPPNTDEAIRHFLMVPRQQLIYGTYIGAVADNQFVSPLPVPNAGPNVRYPMDANGGPNPIYCRVNRVDGYKTFRVSYSIETWINECLPYSSANAAILSNRFSQTDDFDSRFRKTKTTTGRAVFRMDLLTYNGNLADDFRNVLFPPTEPGMRRSAIHATVSSRTNMMDWSCTDTEEMYELGETDPRRGGSGVLSVDASYGLTTVAGEAMAPNVFAEVRVHVEGSKYSTNWNLLQAAFVVASAKLPLGQANQGILLHVAINYKLTDRIVDAAIVYKLFPQGNAAAIGLQQLPLKHLREPAPFEYQNGVYPSFPNDGGTRGTAIGELVSSAIHSACSSPATPDCTPSSAGYGQGGTYCGPGPAIELAIVDYLPTSPTYYQSPKSPGDTAMYDYESYYNSTFDDSGTRACAVTGNGDDPPEILQIRSRITRRRVDWMTRTIGKSPKIPSKYSSDSNLVFEYGEITGKNVELTPDGTTLVYTVSGTYVFAMKNQSGINDTLYYPVPRYTSYQVAGTDGYQNMIGIAGGVSGDYVNGIFDAASSPPEGGTGGMS